jgi:hypothetical protein
MIKYSLNCSKGHTFEGWFQSSDAFAGEVKRRRVACPSCGATKVTKALMSPNLSPRTKKRSVSAEASRNAPSTAQGQTQAVAMPSAATAEMIATLRKLRQEIVAKTDYVGPNFAEEARKIHFDEAPARGIYGEATRDEIASLTEDGVACLPLPVLPEDAN